ncbi:MAG: uracil-DNA glycosylase [Rhodobacteraceae bacterium]|nr:uracil-DNA glycosylase [Paracoccaceae bacterium]
MSATRIICELETLSFKNTFNPYFDRCSLHDIAAAPTLRRYYLREMLERAHQSDVAAIWVGRDLGYRGGRRTGLALTDDVHFPAHLHRWDLKPQKLTTGKPTSERTATIVWSILHQIDAPIFLWNIFPLHPFRDRDAFSNRLHNTHERETGINILNRVVEYIEPQQMVAIGNDAYDALSAAFPCERVFKVRHPSYGGQNEFIAGMHALSSGVPPISGSGRMVSEKAIGPVIP